MDHITMKYPSQSVIHNVHMTGKTLAIQVTKNNATLIKAKPGIRFVTVLPSFKEIHYYIQLYSFNLATKTARRVSCNIITRGLSQLLQCSLREGCCRSHGNGATGFKKTSLSHNRKFQHCYCGAI